MNVLRVLFLLGALACGATWLVWNHAAEWVQRFDARIVKHYTDRHEGRVSDAEEALMRGDREGGIRVLEAALEDLASVRKLDRLDPVKRRVLELLVMHHEAAGRFGRALAHAEAYARFDERDLDNQADLVRLLARVPERTGELDARIVELYRRTPDSIPIRRAYVRWAASRGLHREAFEAGLEARDDFDPAVPTEWRIFWDDGGGFDPAASSRFDLAPAAKASWYTGFFQWTHGVTHVRFDLPPSCELAIDSWELTFWAGGEPSVHEGRTLAIRYNHLRFEDGAILAERPLDPFVVHDVPAKFHDVPKLAVRLRLRLRSHTPHPLAPLEPVKDDPRVMDEIQRWLESEGRPEELAFVEAWRKE